MYRIYRTGRWIFNGLSFAFAILHILGGVTSGYFAVREGLKWFDRKGGVALNLQGIAAFGAVAAAVMAASFWFGGPLMLAMFPGVGSMAGLAAAGTVSLGLGVLTGIGWVLGKSSDYLANVCDEKLEKWTRAKEREFLNIILGSDDEEPPQSHMMGRKPDNELTDHVWASPLPVVRAVAGKTGNPVGTDLPADAGGRSRILRARAPTPGAMAL